MRRIDDERSERLSG